MLFALGSKFAPKPVLPAVLSKYATLTAISSALTVIPLPAPTFNVASPEAAPPVKPDPAVMAVISPSPKAVISEYFASLCPPADEPSWTITVFKSVSTVISPTKPVKLAC